MQALKICPRCENDWPRDELFMRDHSLQPYCVECLAVLSAESAERAKALRAVEKPADDMTKDQRRSRRKRAVPARSVSMKRLSKAELKAGREEYPEDNSAERPKTRGECVNGIRPCPFISCSHHLYTDVSPTTGAIKLNYPELEPDELTESCALDIADRGGVTLEATGDIMNLTRERIRQLEVKALAKVQAFARLTSLRDWDDERRPLRRLPVINTRFLDEKPEDAEDQDEAAE